MEAEASARRGAAAGSAAGGAAAIGAAVLVQWAAPGPAPLGYDPEAWLVWGRELAAGQLDVTAGPAIKPLAILIDAVALSLLGDGAGRALWAVLALAGLLGALLLAWRVAYRAGHRAAWACAAAAAVIATPTMLVGGLTGAAEPLALAGLLLAAQRLARARWAGAALVLGAAGLLRPEALVLLALSAAVGVRAATARGERLRLALVAGLVAAIVVAVWAGLQLVGGGELGGGVDAATALREGQPGTAQRPALAASWAALSMVWPALLIAALSAWAQRRGVVQPVRGAQSAAEHRWLIALGGTWIVAVIAMSELGFSGEPRYLAPGTAALSAGVLAGAAGRLVPAATPAVLVSLLAAALLAGVAVDAGVRGWPTASELARSQRDLDGLLDDPAVRAAASACDRIGVPRFMRPPTAWRLERTLAEIRSPQRSGADCRLARSAEPEPRPAGRWRRIRAVGAWAWWQQAAPEERQADP